MPIVEGIYACPGYPAAARGAVALVGARGRLLLRDNRLDVLGDDPVRPRRWLAAVLRRGDRALRLAAESAFETKPGDNREALRLTEGAYACSSSGRDRSR